MGWSATSGIDQHQFEALVWRDFADSEPAETLATLRSYITALEGAAKKKPRGKAAAKAKAKAKHAAHPPHEAACGAVLRLHISRRLHSCAPHSDHGPLVAACWMA